MTDHHILVTGGAGYIGSHTCQMLAKAGYKPVAYDNLSRGHRWAVRFGPFEEGDIGDAARLDAVFRHYRPVAVVHFAAYSFAGESMQEPSIYLINNVAHSLTLLEAMRRHQCKHMVFSSSCATYGTVQGKGVVSESHPQHPVSTYGLSKLMVEQILGEYRRAYKLQSVCLRYFNASGADPDGDIGEAHDPEPHVIPNLLRVASGANPLFQVFGNEHHTADGTCIRDYIHVNDLADAHVLALNALLRNRASHAYNLGNGHGYSVMELIRAAEQVTGRMIPYEIAPARTGDPPAAIADASLIRTELGWQPKFTAIETILGTAWRWMQRVDAQGFPAPVDVR